MPRKGQDEKAYGEIPGKRVRTSRLSSERRVRRRRARRKGPRGRGDRVSEGGARGGCASTALSVGVVAGMYLWCLRRGGGG